MRVGRGPAGGSLIVKSVELSRHGVFFVWLGGRRDGGYQQTLYRIAHGRRTMLERRHYRGTSPYVRNISTPSVVGRDVFFTTTIPRGRSSGRSVLVRISLRSGRRATAPPPAPFDRIGGAASITRTKRRFLVETYTGDPGTGSGDGACAPETASPCATLLNLGALRFRTR